MEFLKGLINMKTLDSPMGKLIWSPDEGINVSSRGDSIYKILSPFSHSKNYKIPVPGQEHIRADSVEGIWQGLKLFYGITDISQFSGRAQKRKGMPDAFLFGKDQIGYIDARHKIYQPAYIYHLVNNALPKIADDLESRLQKGDVKIHDVEKNPHIDNEQKSYSHASLAAETINLMRKIQLPLKKSDKPNPQASKFTYLHEQVEFISTLRKTMKTREKELTDDIISFAFLFSPDEKYQNLALETMLATDMDRERIKKYSPNKKTEKTYSLLR